MASFLMPVAESDVPGHHELVTGWDVARIGWLGPLMGQFGWFANLAMIPALGLAAAPPHEKPKIRLTVGVIMLLLAVNSAFWGVLPSSAGEFRITAFHPGYWMWMIAVAGSGTWLIAISVRYRKSPA